MSKYECSYESDITSGWLSIGRDLNPKDYLYCKTEEELKDNICEDLADSVNYGDLNVDDQENVKYTIPEEFINEWKKLKQNNEKF